MLWAIPRYGELCTTGWGGLARQRVLVIGETPQRYRIKAIVPTKLAGRFRWLQPGQTGLVPKYAVLLDKP